MSMFPTPSVDCFPVMSTDDINAFVNQDTSLHPTSKSTQKYTVDVQQYLKECMYETEDSANVASVHQLNGRVNNSESRHQIYSENSSHQPAYSLHVGNVRKTTEVTNDGKQDQLHEQPIKVARYQLESPVVPPVPHNVDSMRPISTMQHLNVLQAQPNQGVQLSRPVTHNQQLRTHASRSVQQRVAPLPCHNLASPHNQSVLQKANNIDLERSAQVARHGWNFGVQQGSPISRQGNGVSPRQVVHIQHQGNVRSSQERIKVPLEGNKGACGGVNRQQVPRQSHGVDKGSTRIRQSTGSTVKKGQHALQQGVVTQTRKTVSSLVDAGTQTESGGNCSSSTSVVRRGTFVTPVCTATGKQYVAYVPTSGVCYKVVPADWLHRSTDAAVVKHLGVDDEETRMAIANGVSASDFRHSELVNIRRLTKLMNMNIAQIGATRMIARSIRAASLGLLVELKHRRSGDFDLDLCRASVAMLTELVKDRPFESIMRSMLCIPDPSIASGNTLSDEVIRESTKEQVKYVNHLVAGPPSMQDVKAPCVYIEDTQKKNLNSMLESLAQISGKSDLSTGVSSGSGIVVDNTPSEACSASSSAVSGVLIDVSKLHVDNRSNGIYWNKLMMDGIGKSDVSVSDADSRSDVVASDADVVLMQELAATCSRLPTIDERLTNEDVTDTFFGDVRELFDEKFQQDSGVIPVEDVKMSCAGVPASQTRKEDNLLETMTDAEFEAFFNKDHEDSPFYVKPSQEESTVCVPSASESTSESETDSGVQQSDPMQTDGSGQDLLVVGVESKVSLARVNSGPSPDEEESSFVA